MDGPIEYQMDVAKSVIEPRDRADGSRPTVRRVRYVAHAHCSDGTTTKLAEAENRPLYETIDEGLSKLFGILAIKGVTAVVTVKSNVSLAEGAKNALLNKYASEIEFAAIRFN